MFFEKVNIYKSPCNFVSVVPSPHSSIIIQVLFTVVWHLLSWGRFMIGQLARISSYPFTWLVSLPCLLPLIGGAEDKPTNHVKRTELNARSPHEKSTQHMTFNSADIPRIPIQVSFFSFFLRFFSPLRALPRSDVRICCLFQLVKVMSNQLKYPAVCLPNTCTVK